MMPFISSAVRKVRTVVTANEAITRLNTAYAPLGKAIASFRARNNTCSGSTQPLLCFTTADQQLASSFAVFGAKLRVVPMPPGPAAAAAGKLKGSTSQAELDLQTLESAATLEEYQLMASYPQLTQAMDSFGQDYNNLGTILARTGIILARTARNQR